MGFSALVSCRCWSWQSQAGTQLWRVPHSVMALLLYHNCSKKYRSQHCAWMAPLWRVEGCLGSWKIFLESLGLHGAWQGAEVAPNTQEKSSCHSSPTGSPQSLCEPLLWERQLELIRDISPSLGAQPLRDVISGLPCTAHALCFLSVFSVL